MSCTCTKKKRTRYLGSSLVVATLVACSVLIYISLIFSDSPCELRINCSKRSSIKPVELTDPKCIRTCSTIDCVLHANLLQNTINLDVDQCEDFYSFSCGKFGEKYGKEDNHSAYDVNTMRLKLEVKDLLDNLEADPESASGKMKIAYDSCMNLQSSELQAIPSLMEFLHQIGIPNWPHLEPDFKFTESISTLLGTLAAHHEYSFVTVTNHLVHGEPVFNACITESSDQQLKSHGQAFSFNYFVKRIFSFFDVEDERIAEFMANMRELAPLFNHGGISKLCRSGNVSEIYLDCSADDKQEWESVCEMVEAFVDVANISNHMSKHHVFLDCMNRLRIEKVFKTIDKISHRTVADILVLLIFSAHLDDLNFYFRLLKQKDPESHNLLEEIDLPINHWEHCIEWTIRNMKFALAHEYMKEVISKPVLLEVQSMMQECSEEVSDIISKQEWLTDEEKYKIINMFNKSSALELQINFYLNETYINDYYKEMAPIEVHFGERRWFYLWILNRPITFRQLAFAFVLPTPAQYLTTLLTLTLFVVVGTVTPKLCVLILFHPTHESFFKNVLERQRASFSADDLQLRKHPFLHKLRPFSVNAQAHVDNVIEVGLGNYRFPLFIKNQSRVLNLLILASTIGHEIGHIVEDTFEQNETLSQEAQEVYQNRRSCFEEQFSNFTVEALGVNIDAENTRGENHADSVSIILFDRLIQKYITSDDVLSLPSLPYSSKELMYLIYSEYSCSKFSKERQEWKHTIDSHAPDNFRVIGAMQNSKDFSEVFKCPEGSYMNPVNKCYLLDENRKLTITYEDFS